MNSNILCGKIIKIESGVKGGKNIWYSFKVNNKNILDNISIGFFKKIPFDSLKKFDCVKIEVSNYSTFFNRVVDERVLK